MGVAGELGLTLMDGRPITCLDRTDYPHHPDTAYLISQIEDALCPVAREAIRPGDIVLLRVDGSPQHLGIAGDAGNPISIIHAYAPAHAVVEHVLDEAWECRVQQVYRHPELFSH